MSSRLKGAFAVKKFIDDFPDDISVYSAQNINPYVLNHVKARATHLVDASNQLNQKISVIEFGSRAGALGRNLCVDTKSIAYLGVEAFPPSRIQCFNTFHATCEDFLILELGQRFARKADIFVYADVLEHLTNPWSHLQVLFSLAKPGSTIVASIPNILHHSALEGLGAGRFDYEEWGVLDLTHLRFFTLPTIIELFHLTGWTVDKQTIQCAFDPKGAQIMHRFEQDGKFDIKFQRLTYHVNSRQCASAVGAYQYILTATK